MGNKTSTKRLSKSVTHALGTIGMIGIPSSAPRNTGIWRHRVLVGTATMGTVRIEWHNAICGLVVPVNWSNSTNTPIGFQVADAQNILVQEAIGKGFEWLLLLEDDVIVPPDLFIKMNGHMEAARYPVVSGLYHLKGTMPEPFIFRGRGNGTFKKWKPGDLVACDGVPTGCLLIHASILKVQWERAPKYILRCNEESVQVRRVFETPRYVFADPNSPSYRKLLGTSDLYWCDNILQNKTLAAAGWKRLADEKYPFVVDTSIRCGHIDRETGVVY